MRMDDQAHSVAPPGLLDPRETRETVASLGRLACRDLVVPREQTVQTASPVPPVPPDRKVTKAPLARVAPLATLAPVVERETRETLALLDFLAPLEIAVPRVFREISEPPGRLASVERSDLRVTQVPLVRLVAWVSRVPRVTRESLALLGVLAPWAPRESREILAHRETRGPSDLLAPPASVG